MHGLKLCLALASVTGVAAFAEYDQGPVYDQWSLFTREQAGKWRGVWSLLDRDEPVASLGRRVQDLGLGWRWTARGKPFRDSRGVA